MTADAAPGGMETIAVSAATFASPIRANAETSDHDLVAAIRRGDDHAFEFLYERYHRRIAAYIFGMVNDYGRAEDIAQDVFMSALRRMRATDRPIAFKPWVYEIAKNACIDQFRRTRRAEEVSYDGEDGLGGADYGRLVTTGPSPEAAVEQKLSLTHLQSAFGGLSDTHHRILVMRELDGLSYREIGERLGMSRASVESTLFRARRRLSEEYEELVSGERCSRVQLIIDAAATSSLGARDSRKLAKHVAHCQSCRRHARMAGVDITGRQRPVRTRIAAFLPLPAFLRRRLEADEAGIGGPPGGVGQHAPALAQWSAQLSAAADPAMAGWARAAAAAVTIAAAGIGAGAVTSDARLDAGSSLPSGAVTKDRNTVRVAASPTQTVSGAKAPAVAAKGTGTSGAATTTKAGSPRTGSTAATGTARPAPDQRDVTGSVGLTASPTGAALPVPALQAPAVDSSEMPNAPRPAPPEADGLEVELPQAVPQAPPASSTPGTPAAPAAPPTGAAKPTPTAPDTGRTVDAVSGATGKANQSVTAVTQALGG